jgi:hypothetical protein
LLRTAEPQVPAQILAISAPRAETAVTRQRRALPQIALENLSQWPFGRIIA